MRGKAAEAKTARISHFAASEIWALCGAAAKRLGGRAAPGVRAGDKQMGMGETCNISSASKPHRSSCFSWQPDSSSHLRDLHSVQQCAASFKNVRVQDSGTACPQELHAGFDWLQMHRCRGRRRPRRMACFSMSRLRRDSHALSRRASIPSHRCAQEEHGANASTFGPLLTVPHLSDSSITPATQSFWEAIM